MRPDRLLVGLALGLLLAALATLLVLSPIALIHERTGALERIYGSLAVTSLAQSQAGPTMPSPPAAGQAGAGARGQTSARLLENAGRNAYIGSCAQCHGDKGDGKGALGQGSAPPATDLTASEARQKTDAQLFWIVKNGLSFTAMPSFARDFPDDDVAALVVYIRTLQQGAPQQPVSVPTPTSEQLRMANPQGEPAQRGAAVYFAQNCQRCHGPIGQAPGELGLFDLSDVGEALRRGRPGMPIYSRDKINDAQLKDLIAYMQTFPNSEEE